MDLRRRQTMLLLVQSAALARPSCGHAGTGGLAQGPAGWWALYARALAAQIGPGAGGGAFKAASGMAVADWEVINYTGLPATRAPGPPGTPCWQRAYAWGDAMPDYAAPDYLPGPSWYSQYAAFIGALAPSPRDARAVAAARARLTADRMRDAHGATWPAYRITPGLHDFMTASLQSLVGPKPPQIRFRLALPSLAPDGSAPFFGIGGCAYDGLMAPSTGVPGQCATLIEFAVQSTQLFQVQPGQWYDAAAITGYSDRIDPASALANKALFGPRGMLNMRTAQILVALGRTVTLHMAPGPLRHCTAAATAAQAAGQSSINIGGFCFDASRTDIRAGAGALTFRDNTNAPYVIGVTTQVLAPAARRAPARR